MTEADRKPHHHGNLRQAVIDDALLAAQTGTLEQASIREMSRRIGVSPAAVYRHFADREAIMAAVAQAGFDRLAEAFEAALPFASQARDAAHARDRLIALGGAYVRFAVQNYGLWRLMFGPTGQPSPHPSGRPSTYDWLDKALGELHAHGVIGPPTPEAKFFAWTSIHGLSDLNASPAAPEARADQMVAAHCDRIIAACR